MGAVPRNTPSLEQPSKLVVILLPIPSFRSYGLDGVLVIEQVKCILGVTLAINCHEDVESLKPLREVVERLVFPTSVYSEGLSAVRGRNVNVKRCGAI